MPETTDQLLLKFSADKLTQLAGRIGDCLGRLDYDQVWMRSGDNANSIGNLVLHVCGNMRQWIISGVGGKPDIRVRDREFAARGDVQAAELKERLHATVAEATATLGAVTAERLLERVKIQNYEITVLEAILHVMEHFAQHTGQILFATKQITGGDLGYYKHLNKPAHEEKTP